MGFVTFLKENLFTSFILVAVFALFLVSLLDSVFDSLLNPILDKMIGKKSFSSAGVEIFDIHFPIGKIINSLLRIFIVAIILYYVAGRPNHNVIKQFL